MNATLLQNLQIVDEGGTTTVLYSGTYNLLFLDGAGAAPVERIMQRIPLAHGMVDRGYRLQARKMSLALYVAGNTEAEVESAQDTLAAILSPTDNPLTLKATRLDGGVRQIEVYLDGTLDFPQSERLGPSAKIMAPLTAPEPTWRDVSAQTASQSLVSTSIILTATPGAMSFEDWPVFSITGPATGLAITHQQIATTLSFSSAIPSGETFTIDLRPGYKRVYRASDGANRLSYVNSSTLAAFSNLKVLPLKALKLLNAAYTANTFAITASGTTAASAALITWYKRYLSL